MKTPLTDAVRTALADLALPFDGISGGAAFRAVHLSVHGPIYLVVEPREDDRQLRASAILPEALDVPEVHRLSAAAALCGLSTHFGYGSFDLDFADGQVIFRVGVDADPGEVGPDLVGDLIQTVGQAMDGCVGSIATIAAGRPMPPRRLTLVPRAEAATDDVPLHALVRAYLEGCGWPARLTADGIEADHTDEGGSWVVRYVAEEPERRLRVYSIWPDPIPQLRRMEVAAMLMRMNIELTIGNFEMDPADGIVRMRTALQFAGLERTRARVHALTQANLSTFSSVLPAIRAVAWSGCDPASEG